MQTLGDRIRVARRATGWSQAKLAARLGVTASAVGHWERPNGHQPSSENLIEIAKHLSIRVEWLAIGFGVMRQDGRPDSEADSISLSVAEEALVKHYQGLSSPSRALLMQFMEALTVSAGARDRAR